MCFIWALEIPLGEGVKTRCTLKTELPAQNDTSSEYALCVSPERKRIGQ